MADIYKNPTLYYILVPIIAALWSLLIGGVYLPDAERNWQVEKAQYIKAEKIMTEILNLDPERLADSKTATAEFDYTSAIDKIASRFKISATNYNISSKPARTKSGQKSQECQVVLKKIDITRFAKFLSAIQLRWANLQCEKVTLTKTKGLPDMWKVDLNFKYYY
ncbi:hypothetical protein ES703_37849 [subsurface metagenome]